MGDWEPVGPEGRGGYEWDGGFVPGGVRPRGPVPPMFNDVGGMRHMAENVLDREEVFFKIEVKVDGDWLPMERIDPVVAKVEARHADILRDAHETYGKPVRLVRVDRSVTVLKTLEVA